MYTIRTTIFCIAMALIGWAAGGSEVRAQVPSEYTIHPGDKLMVGVYDDPKLLPQELSVAPDGKISYPMAGVITAGGKTVEQVRTELEAKFKKYVTDPLAIVILTEVKGNVVYVIGQVVKPGSIVMNPAINVMQALSIAGGGNPFAKLDSIIVIRSSANGTQRVIPFHFGQVSSGRDLQQNIMLESGDVVVVP